MASPDNELRLYFENAVESVTSAFTTIESDHAAIHRAEGYSAYVSTATVADGSSLLLGITTPTSTAGKYIHFKEGTMGMGNSPASFRFIEDAHATLTTATLAAYQRNRARNTTATASMCKILGNVVTTYTASTGTADTVLVQRNLYGAADSKVSADVSSQAYSEWVLAPGTNYMFVATNNSGTATSAYIDLYWYEEGRY